jgi:uncharacterized protein YjbJ (UPF0337 family)
MINDNILKGKWNSIKGDIKKKWGQLTDDDLSQVEGDSNKLHGLFQSKLGYTQEKARTELNDFLSKYDDNAPDSVKRDTTGERDF